MRGTGPALVAALVLSAACASGAVVTPTLDGYLSGAETPDLSPPAFDAKEARAFEVEPGFDRVQLALVHAELRPPWAAQHFDCALGARLRAADRPALDRIMGRLLTDVEAATARLARSTPRPRPFQTLAGLEPCQRIDEAIRAGPSWPSGGAAAGAAYGELFAALAPDRAEASRRIGREIGLSRVVCRMNWPSDVEAGAELGRAVFAEAARAPDFQADLDAAHAELAVARAEGLTSPGCAAERRALGIRPGAG